MSGRVCRKSCLSWSHDMSARIFRYVVRVDCGSAPRPYGGFCTLAICKPRIRKAAAVGDWVVGFRSHASDQVVYAMKVAEILSFQQYWIDARFQDRRPHASPIPDNIYCQQENGEFQQVPNPVHDEGNIAGDLSGYNVLIGTRFWYFGAASVALPTELIHLVPYPRGHTVHKNRRPDDIAQMERWLAAWPHGVHGEPRDAWPETLTWLAAGITNRSAPASKTASVCSDGISERPLNGHRTKGPGCRC